MKKQINPFSLRFDTACNFFFGLDLYFSYHRPCTPALRNCNGLSDCRLVTRASPQEFISAVKCMSEMSLQHVFSCHTAAEHKSLFIAAIGDRLCVCTCICSGDCAKLFVNVSVADDGGNAYCCCSDWSFSILGAPVLPSVFFFFFLHLLRQCLQTVTKLKGFPTDSLGEHSVQAGGETLVEILIKFPDYPPPSSSSIGFW